MTKKETKTKEGFKFSTREINILKHFATINNSQVIYPDRFIVYSPSLTLYADYLLLDDKKKPLYSFEAFGLYHVNEFLQIYSLYSSKDDDFEIERKESYLEFKSTNSKTIYPIVDIDILERYSKKLNEDVLNEQPILAEFILSEDKISIFKKIGNVIKANKIIFNNNNGKIVVMIKNSDVGDSGINHFDEITKDDIIKNEMDENVDFSLDFDNFVLMKDDYKVKLYEDMILFESNSGLLRYLITLESEEDL